MTLKPIIMAADGLCRSGDIPSSEQLISIDQPVGSGPKARNKDRDVRTIQKALNDLPASQGRPSPLLVVDGICGPKTNKAIGDFQLKHFGISGKDGVIEPGKQTINRINQILFSNVPVDPAAEAQIRIRFVSHLDLVRSAITRSMANLDFATLTSTINAPSILKANERLDRHFRLNTLSPSKRAAAIQDIKQVFTTFRNCLSLPPEVSPGFLGPNAFLMDTTGDFRIAFTFSNGFHRRGEREKERNIPIDRIHLGRRAFFALDNDEFCAFIMLHEMAHFVGVHHLEPIIDHGRGWFTDDTIKKLTTDQRLHNADSYAAFATECRTGSAVKPAYVKAANTSR